MAWKRSSKLLASGAFPLLGLILLGTYLFLSIRHRSSDVEEGAATHESPRLRRVPLRVDAKSRFADLIRAEELQRVLSLMEPYWEYERAGDALHALRLWGPDTVFPDAPPHPVPPGVKVWQPRDMVALYLDEAVFQARFPGAQPYFSASRHGLSERKAQNIAATVHDNNFLHLAAEIGLPIDTPMRWGGRRFTLADIFAHAFAWFDTAQELEFTAVAFALYLQPRASWTNRFGERYDLDGVADRLVDRDLSKCSCYGTHVPYALAVLLAVDEQEPVLSERVRQQVRERLKALAVHLENSQGAAGWWDRKWAPGLQSREPFEPEETELIRSTGHHLEWMALAPADCRPNDACMRRTVRFLLKALAEFHRSDSQAYYFNAGSHAGRALVLLAGRRYACEFMAGKWSERIHGGQGGKNRDKAVGGLP